MCIKSLKPRDYIYIFAEAENYIRHMVWRKLGIAPTNKYDYFEFIKKSIDANTYNINIATLNHDLLLERYLRENRIKYSDGFGEVVAGVRYWENTYSNSQNLYKLHGSIDWTTLHTDTSSIYGRIVGIVMDGDIDHPKNPAGEYMRSVPDPIEPNILIGTYNKVYEYTEDIFADVYCQFRDTLSKTDVAVITGYSFGDKGINNVLTEWLYSDPSHSIILIHPDPIYLIKTRARTAIRKAYSFIPSKFHMIPKKIEDVNWADIEKVLASL